MKIINQTTTNECGICAINMIVNYYYHNDKDRKNQIYSLTENMNNNGLSIIEIENLLNKFNIEAISYECEWEEIFELDKPFIMLIKYNEIYHYVVGIIKHNFIYVYDPIGKKTKLNIKNKLPNFTGYIITTKFKNKKIKTLNFNNSIYKNISISLNLAFIIINILEFIFSMLCSYLISKLISIDIYNSFTDTLWKISFIYIVILLISELFNFLNNLIKKWYFFKILPKSLDHFWENINSKTISFFISYSEQELSQIYSYVYKIVKFYCFFTSELVSEILIFIITFSIGLTINFNNIYFLILLMIINLILMFFTLKIDKDIVKINHKNNPINEQNLINYFKNKKNITHYIHQIDHAKEIQLKINQTLHKNIKLDNNLNLINIIDKIVNNIFQFLIIILIMFQQKNFGSLFICINILNLYTRSLKSIINFIKEYKNQSLIIDYVKKIYIQNSLPKDTKLKILQINSISIDNNLYIKNLCISKQDYFQNIIVNNLVNLYDPYNLIKINNNHLNDVKSILFLTSTLIYINANNIEFPFVNYSLPADIIEYISKNNSENLSYELKLIAILITLSNEKNKIIVINENFQNIKDDFLTQKIKKLLSIINEQNFIINNNMNPKLLNIYENFI